MRKVFDHQLGPRVQVAGATRRTAGSMDRRRVLATRQAAARAASAVLDVRDPVFYSVSYLFFRKAMQIRALQSVFLMFAI
jgi:LmbE family N-acetylglucosaminyl deacetylase